MKFSIIMPVYNKAETVRAAIESIFAQSIDDYEVVIVDDGSKDSLENVIDSLDKTHLQFIRQENGGVSVARNTGISNSKGDYICFLDADDKWEDNHLEVLNEMIEKYPDAETFVTSHKVITAESKVIHSSEALDFYDADFVTDDFIGLMNKTSYGIINSNSVCVKKSYLDKHNIRFEPGVKIGEDTDVWYRLGLKGKVAVTKVETTLYRREYSTATKSGSHVHGWIFSLRVPQIMADEEISDEVKKSVNNLIDRYKMTSSREYMVSNERKAAKEVLAQVSEKKGARYLLTWLFTLLPYSVCRALLKR